MIIERLIFQVSPSEFTKDFILADKEVWTPWLVRQSGFIRKEHRIPSRGIVEILVFWKSRADQDRAAAKKSEMEVVERMMKSRSPGTYRLFSAV